MNSDPRRSVTSPGVASDQVGFLPQQTLEPQADDNKGAGLATGVELRRHEGTVVGLGLKSPWVKMSRKVGANSGPAIPNQAGGSTLRDVCTSKGHRPPEDQVGGFGWVVGVQVVRGVVIEQGFVRRLPGI